MNNSYIYQDSIHNLNAPRAIVPMLIERFTPRSVLDIGCGIGTWLKVFEEYGVTEYLGIDSESVRSSELLISQNKFHATDLSQHWSLGKKYDLVVSLEVGEHLPDGSADAYVASMVKHSDTIIFSAAIPGQGGQHHINERWPDYWQRKFEMHGFYFHDDIRPHIWRNENIEWWYRQNIFVVTKEAPSAGSIVNHYVHPELFKHVLRNHDHFTTSINEGVHGVKDALRIFYKALRFKLKSLMGLK
jgi:SAM-dependent methyltransferase